MTARVRVIAMAAAACLAAATVAAVLLPSHRAGSGDRVSVRSLSSTDVLAVPAHPTTPQDYRVVVLGDSVATATGCGCPPFGPRLAELLAKPLAKPVRVASLAHDGETSSGLDSQLDSDASTAAEVRTADAVAVVVGANDFDSDDAGTGCSGTGTACFDTALKALPAAMDHALTRIRALARPQVKILVLGYWNVFLDGSVGASKGATYQQTSGELTDRVNAVLAQSAARAQATYVDLLTAFHGSAGHDVTALLAADGDHPSAAGHQRIAQLLAAYLAVGAG
jgi:lysophospholipase L1-like esterase